MTPVRRVDRHRHAVGHAVRDAQELDREDPTVTRSRGLTGTSRRLRVPAFPSTVASSPRFELRFEQRQRQRRAVDRPVDDGSTCGTAPM